MKKQLLHEQHNRQEKARKPDYREELRTAPRRQHVPNQYPSSRSTSGGWIWTVKHSIREIAPAVVVALHQLSPRVNVARLRNVINSELGQHKATVRTSTIPRTQPAKVRETANALLRAIGRTLPGQFYIWHEQAKARCQSGPAFNCEIPPKFRRWLERMAVAADGGTAAQPALERARPAASEPLGA